MSVQIDDILADLFPASDPPSWTLGFVSASLASADSSRHHEPDEADHSIVMPAIAGRHDPDESPSLWSGPS
jgi:hypothetical protein